MCLVFLPSELKFMPSNACPRVHRIDSLIRLAIGLGLAALLPFQTSCRQGDEEKPLQLALNWYPDAQHGGFYAALMNGYYADEGLQVEIMPGGPNVPVLEKVAQGRAQFGVSNADQILLKRNQGAALVALLAPLQESPRCIMVHRASGITSFDELSNVTLALGPGRPFAEYLKRHAAMKDVRIVNYSGSVKRFVDDPKFAQQGYSFSEPIVAEQLGADPVLLMLKDLGFSPYSSCLFADQAFIDENPDVVRRFVRATKRGWLAYLESPQSVNERIHELNPELDLASLEKSAVAIRSLCIPTGKSADDVGQMELARWEKLLQQLKEIEFVDPAMQLDDAFDLQFLSEANDRSEATKDRVE